MYQIQIDVSQLQLIDKGTHFVLAIPTKVYSTTNPPLPALYPHHHPFNKQGHSDAAKLGSPTNTNPSTYNQVSEQPPQIKHTLRLKNTTANNEPESIQQHIQKLQAKYEELFRSRINDALNQAQADLAAKREKQLENQKKRLEGQGQQPNNSRFQEKKPPDNRSNIFENRTDGQRSFNQNNTISNTNSNPVQNQSHNNPFAKNTLGFSSERAYSSTNTQNSIYGPTNVSSNSVTNKNPFMQPDSNSLYRNNNQFMENPVSLSQVNSFIGNNNNNSGGSGLFDVASSKTARTNNKYKRGPIA